MWPPVFFPPLQIVEEQGCSRRLREFRNSAGADYWCGSSARHDLADSAGAKLGGMAMIGVPNDKFRKPTDAGEG
jgi:hypothetical protein